MREQTSCALRKGINRYPLEHALNDLRIFFGQDRIKLLHPSQNRCNGRLSGDCSVIEFSDHHNHEVGIGEERSHIERRLRHVDLGKDLKKAVNLIRYFHVDEVEDLTKELVYRCTSFQTNNLSEKDTQELLVRI